MTYLRSKYKYQELLSGLSWVYIFGLLVVLSIQVPALAVIKGDIELLKVIADGYEENLKKLKTWQGKADIQWSFDLKTAKHEQYQLEKQKATFLIDCKLDAVRWTYESFDRIQVQDNKKNVLNPIRSSGMIRTKYAYTMDLPYEKNNHTESRYLRISTKKQLIRNFESKNFDPLHIITKNIYSLWVFFSRKVK